jgi:hypothetical protein
MLANDNPADHNMKMIGGASREQHFGNYRSAERNSIPPSETYDRIAARDIRPQAQMGRVQCLRAERYVLLRVVRPIQASLFLQSKHA